MDLRIMRAMQIIEQHLAEDVDYDRVAEQVGLSTSRFHHLFAEQTGVTPGGYLRRVRLDAAAMRLRWTNESVGQIASSFGYDSQSSFNRAFVERFGATPGRFRRDLVRWPNYSLEGAVGKRVGLREFEVVQCLARRYFGPFENVHRHWGHFLSTLPEDLDVPGQSLYLGLVHDDPRFTPEDQIRYDCCIVVSEVLAGVDLSTAAPGLHTLTTRAGLYAFARHTGSYAGIGGTYSRILDHWLKDSRHTVTDDPAIELYTVPQSRVGDGDLDFTVLLPLY